MRKTTLYIVRHGETDNNVHHRFQGRTNMPLNQRGLQQAKSLLSPMSGIDLDIIYASPYLRTMQTAKQVRGNRDIPIIQDPGLAEIDCGQWEGLTRTEIVAKWPGMIELWQDEPDALCMPDGETFRQVQERAFSSFANIVNHEWGKKVGLVSHMLTIQLIMAKLMNIPINDVWKMNRLENTSITTLHVWENGDFEIETWGDDSHLPLELRNEYVRIAGFVRKDYDAAYTAQGLQGRHNSRILIR